MTLQRSTLDWLMEIISLVALVASWAFVAESWSTLPDVVPTHFGITGAPNGWGSRQAMWLVPGMGLLLYIVLTVAARYPRFVNLPFRVDRDAPEVRRIIVRILASAKAVTMLLFVYIVHGQIQSAMNRTDSMGIALLPLFLVATILPLAVYMKQLRRYKQ